MKDKGLEKLAEALRASKENVPSKFSFEKLIWWVKKQKTQD